MRLITAARIRAGPSKASSESIQLLMSCVPSLVLTRHVAQRAPPDHGVPGVLKGSDTSSRNLRLHHRNVSRVAVSVGHRTVVGQLGPNRGATSEPPRQVPNRSV